MSRALIRTSLWLAAAGAALAAAAVSAAHGDDGFVPIFLILGAAGLVAAWADRWSGSGRLGIVAVGVAVGWVGIAVAALVLLAWAEALCGCTRPEPMAETEYLGVAVTAWRMLAIVGGAAAASAAALLRG
ncbi:MAG: hypothetical protein OEW24_04780 [Chloroflexota bacterium]|nr:hypothetical protein [Chloroflexota bacterium]